MGERNNPNFPVRVWRQTFLFALLIFLTGCIQQDIRIVLRADGSGEYHIRKVLSPPESFLVAGMPAQYKEELKAQLNIQEEKYGIEQVSSNIAPDPADPNRHMETSVYTFKELGRALPALENIIDMGPRYAYRDGRFVIFRLREKEEWDGADSDMMKDAYLNLTIELPAEPTSSNGTVQGKTVSWNFDAEALKRFHKSGIGKKLIEASIPASAIQVDLKPRLVPEKKKTNLKDREEFNPLNNFSARFPILKDAQETRATLDVYFPIDELSLPISYKNLKIKSLVVEGKNIDSTLTSNVNGIYNGKNQWGQAVPGFPVKLDCTLDNPWISKVDRLEISTRINAAIKTGENIFEIVPGDEPGLITPKTSNPKLGKLALMKVELGSGSAMWPGSSVSLLTATAPDKILTFYLDTDYGLRYKAQSMTAKEKSKKDYSYDALKPFIEQNFSDDERFYQYEVNFSKMPGPPFTLIVETIEEQRFQPKTLILENIDVSP